MHLNPIVKKDVRVQSRSMKICWGIFAYELILALVFFFQTDFLLSHRFQFNPGIFFCNAHCRLASFLQGDHQQERQTFDIMMTTSMTPFSVILGKVMTAIVQSMFYVVAGMPVMAGKAALFKCFADIDAIPRQDEIHHSGHFP